MFRFMLLCLIMFSPVETDIASKNTQRIARLELFFDYHDSHPHFKECVKNRNSCLPEEKLYLRLLQPPQKLSSSKERSKLKDPSKLARKKDRFLKKKFTDKKALPSK